MTSRITLKMEPIRVPALECIRMYQRADGLWDQMGPFVSSTHKTHLCHPSSLRPPATQHSVARAVSQADAWTPASLRL